MNVQITITPEKAREKAIYARKPLITISASMITIAERSAHMLALKKGDHILFDVIDYKLYVRYDPSGKGFEIKSAKNNGSLNAYASGIKAAIEDAGFRAEGKSLRFELGELKEGGREMILRNPVEKPAKSL